MKKTIYLHIGMHKTATTTIQQGLFYDKAKLNKSGWYCPLSGTTFLNNAGQHNIAWQLLGSKLFNLSFGDITKVIEEVNATAYDNLIISSEEFSKLSIQQVEKLAEYLIDFNVYIIVYLRRQDLVLRSTWSEMVKKGNITEPFDIWIKNHLTLEKLSYYKFLNKWEKSFGKKFMKVGVFEKNQLNGHIYHDFLAKCNIPDFQNYPIPQSVNISPSYKTLELIRMVIGELKDTKAYTYRKSISKKIEEYSESKGWNNEALNIINKELFDMVITHFENSNRMVANIYLNKDRLFLEPFVERGIDKFQLSAIDQRELLTMYSSIVVDMAELIYFYEDAIKSEKSAEYYNTIIQLQQSKMWKFINQYRQIEKSIKKILHLN